MKEINHLEDVNCYNCGSNKHKFYASENGFTLVKCQLCGLLYVTPRPTAAKIRGAHEYGMHQGDMKLNVTGEFTPTKIKDYLNILKGLFGCELLTRKRTWLDIGCGHGEFIVAIQQHSKGNIIVKGLEPNIEKRKSARRKGLDVSLFDLDTHTEQYDFISLLNVYSHLPDPKVSINDWKNLLKSKGELLLETGDTAELDSKDHPIPFLLPDHLSFTSEKIIVDILKKAGFEIITVKKYPAFKWDIIKIVKEISNFFFPNKSSLIKHYIKSYNRDMYIRAKKVIF
jgi:SAM-dependent methyltransferase